MRTDFSIPQSEPGDIYKLLTAVVVPRPIAWVSTVSEDGVVNLAPHSFYNVACARPPIVSFSSVGKKDTLRNVVATREFVVNLASAPMIEAINNSSANFAPDQSEVEHLGIEMEPCRTVTPPRVARSPVSIECTLHSTHELGDSTLILGDITMISIADEVILDGHPEFTLLEPLSRLGKNQWALHPEVLAVRRPGRPDDIT